MSIVEQTFLKPGTYRVRGVDMAFSRDDLKDYARNTQAVLDSGYQIPVFDKHAPAGIVSGGPRIAGDGASALDGCGWLESVSVNPDGSLKHRLKITDPLAAQRIKNESIKFTSPELSRAGFTNGDGQTFGKHIRHVALTNTPRTQNQGEFAEAGEAVQFSMDDLQEVIAMADDFNEKKKEGNPFEGNKSGVAEEAVGNEPDELASTENKETATDNPDMPTDQNAVQDLDALMALLEEAGMPVASNADLTDNAQLISHLITALRTKNAMEAKAVVEKADEAPEEPIIEEKPPVGAQFSEEAQTEIDSLRAQITAGHDKTANDNRTALQEKLKGCPPGFVTQFCADLGDDLETVQFAEGVEEPVFTLTQVIDKFKECVPDFMQFAEGEDGLTEEQHPNGEAHFTGNQGMTDEQADKIVAETRGGWTNDNSLGVPNPGTLQPAS